MRKRFRMILVATRNNLPASERGSLVTIEEGVPQRPRAGKRILGVALQDFYICRQYPPNIRVRVLASVDSFLLLFIYVFSLNESQGIDIGAALLLCNLQILRSNNDNFFEPAHATDKRVETRTSALLIQSKQESCVKGCNFEVLEQTARSHDISHQLPIYLRPTFGMAAWNQMLAARSKEDCIVRVM